MAIKDQRMMSSDSTAHWKFPAITSRAGIRSHYRLFCSPPPVMALCGATPGNDA